MCKKNSFLSRFRVKREPHRRQTTARLLAVVIGSVLPYAATADTIDWTLGANGNWDVSTNWTNANTHSNVVPGSLDDAVISDIQSVLKIGGVLNTHSISLQNSRMSLTDVALTTALSLNNGSFLTMEGNSSLGAGSSVVLNNGSQMNLYQTGVVDNATFQFTGSRSFISLQNGLDLGAGMVIHGANSELLYGTMTNSGLISADVAGGKIFLDGGTLTNAGTLTAQNGGTLQIFQGSLVNSGTISASGASSLVRLKGSIQLVPGGQLLTSSGGQIELFGANVANTGNTLDFATNYLLNNGSANTISGGNISHSGSLSLSSNTFLTLTDVGLDTGLTINGGDITLAGGSTLGTGVTMNSGVLRLNSTATIDNATLALNGGQLNLPRDTTFGSGVTVQAQSGYIFANNPGAPVTLTNNGTIDVTGNGGIRSGYNIVNTGTISAQNAGFIQINGNAITNTGTLSAVNGGNFLFSSGSLENHGIISSSGANSNFTFLGLNNSTLVLGSGSQLVTTGGGKIYLNGNITNTGNTIDASNSGLNFLDASLTGGSIAHSDGLNFVYPSSHANITLTDVALDGGLNINTGTATIYGGTTFGVGSTTNVINHGAVAFNNVTSIDNVTFNLANFSELHIDTDTTFGSGVTVQSQAGLLLNNSNVPVTLTNNGTIHTEGHFFTSPGNGSLSLVNNGTLSAAHGGQMNLAGALANTGTISVQSGGSFSYFSDVLTNTGTISADGNQSLVDLGGTLALGTGSHLITSNGGKIVFDQTTIDNTGRTLDGNLVEGTGNYRFQQATISGGNIVNSGSLKLDYNNYLTLKNVSLDAGLNITNGADVITGNTTFGIGSTTYVSNNGILNFNGATLSVSGAAFVTNPSGTINFIDSTFNNGGHVLDPTNLIGGTGNYTFNNVTIDGGQINNSGSLSFANGNSLTFQDVAFDAGLNVSGGTGTIVGNTTFGVGSATNVSNGGVLTFQGGTIALGPESFNTYDTGLIAFRNMNIDNTSSTLNPLGLVGGTDNYTFDHVTITGGNVQNSYSFILGSGSTLKLQDVALDSGLTITGGKAIAAGTTSLGGGTTISNGGTLAFTNAPFVDNAAIAFGDGNALNTVSFDADTTLGNNLSLHSGSFVGNVVNAGSAAITLTNHGQIYADAGTLNLGGSGGTLHIVNDGYLTAYNGGVLTYGGGTLTNNGLISVDGSGAAFNVGGTFVTGSGSMVTSNGGAINFNGATFANAGSTLNADQLVGGSGNYLLNGATISGGSVVNSLYLHLGSGSSLALQDVNLDNGLTISGGSVTLLGSTNLGSGTSISNNGTLAFGAAATIDNASVFFTDSSIGNRIVLNGDTTIGNSAAISGQSGALVNNSGAAITLTNNGILEASAAGGQIRIAPTGGDIHLLNAGNLSASNGGQIVFQGNGSLTNNNSIDIRDGSELQFQSGGTLQNNGQIYVSGGAQFTIASGTLNNAGLIQVGNSGSVANLSGTLVLSNGSQLTTFDGGAVHFNGTTIDNAGRTLDASSFVGGDSNYSFAGATVSGGTITHSESLMVTSGQTLTLTNVGLTGGLNIDGGSVALSGTTHLRAGSAANISEGGSVALNGSSPYDQAIRFADGTAANAVTLTQDTTLGANGLVHGMSGGIVNGGSSTLTLTNNGIISADVAGGQIVIGSSTGGAVDVINNGALSARNGGTLTVDNFLHNNGLISADGSGSLVNLNGTFEPGIGSTLTTSNGGFIKLTGVLNNAGQTTEASTLLGGASNYTFSGTVMGGALVHSNALNLTTGTTVNLNGVSLDAGLSLSGGSATLSGGTGLGSGSTTTFSNGSNLAFQGSQTLNNLTLVFADANSGNQLSLDSNLVIGAGTTIQGSSGSIQGLGNSTTTLTNNGNITVTVAGGSIRFLDPPLDVMNNHTIAATVGGSISYEGGGNFTNSSTGVLSATGSGSTISLTGNLTNSGAVNIGTGASLNLHDSLNQNAGSFIANGTVNIDSGHSLNLTGGILGGGGTINGTVANTGGTVGPGNSPGKLTINGNYAQGSTGILSIDLGGYGQGTTYDWLDVTGNASLNGALDIDLYGGFTPHLGDTFTFLTAASRNGSFNGINSLNNGYAYSVFYDANDARIVVTEAAGVFASTPEPGTWAMLFGLGLTGLMLGRRRARRA